MITKKNNKDNNNIDLEQKTRNEIKNIAKIQTKNPKENSKIRKKEIFIILLLYIKNTQNVNKIYRILISD